MEWTRGGVEAAGAVKSHKAEEFGGEMTDKKK